MNSRWKEGIAQALEEKARRGLRARQGVRAARTEDIFVRRGYIGPEDLVVVNYPKKRPLAAFNPGAVLWGEKILVFPRLIFDYYSYTSSIGVFEVDVETLLSGEIESPLETRIVLWPQEKWEAVKGCEDARLSLGERGFQVLYTGVGMHEEGGEDVPKSVLAFAELDEGFTLRRKGYFSVAGETERLVPNNKDSALIEVRDQKAVMLTRPMGVGKSPDMCWRAEADLGELIITVDSLQPILVPEPWEYKVGWSTNTVRLSRSEFLVGWHGVLREDFSYRNGLALVDGEGQLLAVSDYLLVPQGLVEQYGDRSLAIFGDGLLLYRDILIWIGGVSDYCIGIFVAELEDVRSRLRRV